MGRLIFSHWKKTSSKRGSAPVITEPFRGTETTFRELDGMISKRADELARLSDPKNRIVAFQFANSADWLAVFLACQATGAIALPVDPDVPADGIKAILTSLRAAIMIDSSGARLLNHGTRRYAACLVKLTSGSTGAPTPLFFSDDQMLADGQNIMRTMSITLEDSNLATIPMGHSYGLGNLVMPCIMAGCPIHVCREPFPHAIAEAAAMAKPSVYPTVPAILRTLVRSDVKPSDFLSIRLWISAGSMLEAAVAQAFSRKFASPVHNFYGSSETGGIAYDDSGQRTLDGGSVGKPLRGVKVSLSQSGRLLVASKAVYTRNNSRRSRHIGSFLLPDMTTILNDGSIRLEGRTANIAKIGGKRLSLAEVESALTSLEGVDDCHVDAYGDPGGRTRLVAVIAGSIPVDEVQMLLKKRLATWKIPSRWIIVDCMPVNARGKRDRAAVRKIIRQALQQQGRQ